MLGRKRKTGKTGKRKAKSIAQSVKQLSKAVAKIPKSMPGNMMLGLKARTGGPLGRTYTTTLNYADWFTIDPGVGLSTSYIFATNSAYDPNQNTIGHQPYGFDQLMALYSNYEVISSTIKLSVANTDSTQPLIVGIAQRDSVTPLNLLTVTELWERPDIKTVLAQGLSEYPTTIVDNYSTKAFYQGKRKAGDDVFLGTATTNPAEMNFYHIVASPWTSATDLPAIRCFVQMRMKVRFTGPKDLAQS